MKPITSHLSKNGFDSLRKSRNIRMEKSSTAIGEMYPSHCSPNVMQRRQKGWPSVRAQVRLQRECATRPIEKTGDSSTPLRMTCVAITIGEPLSPHLRRNCHPEEALPAGRQAPGRRRIYCGIGSSPCDLHVSIPERQHVNGSRITLPADEILDDFRDFQPGVWAGTEGRLQAKNDKWNR